MKNGNIKTKKIEQIGPKLLLTYLDIDQLTVEMARVVEPADDNIGTSSDDLVRYESRSWWGSVNRGRHSADVPGILGFNPGAEGSVSGLVEFFLKVAPVVARTRPRALVEALLRTTGAYVTCVPENEMKTIKNLRFLC